MSDVFIKIFENTFDTINPQTKKEIMAPKTLIQEKRFEYNHWLYCILRHCLGTRKGKKVLDYYWKPGIQGMQICLHVHLTK